MRQRRTFQLLGVVIAILAMTVGYAAIQDINLIVTGNIVATPDQANFKVAFTGTPTYVGDGHATLRITGNTTATMDVSGLQSAGDTLTATFTVSNMSPDLIAYLSCSASNNQPTFFQVTTTLGTQTLSAQSTTTLQVEVLVLKTLTSTTQDELYISLLASPAPISGDGNTISNTTVSNDTVISNNTVSNNVISNNTI